VDTTLASPVPIFIFWGAGLVVLYNDAAIPIVSTKHPASLGKPAHEVWKEAWNIIGPAFPAAVYDNSPFLEHYNRAMDERTEGEFEAFYPAGSRRLLQG